MIEWHRVVDESDLPPIGEFVLTYRPRSGQDYIKQSRYVKVDVTVHDPYTGTNEIEERLDWQDKNGSIGPIYFSNDWWAYFNLPKKDGDLY